MQIYSILQITTFPNYDVQPTLHISRHTSSGHSLYILINQFVQHIYKYHTDVQPVIQQYLIHTTFVTKCIQTTKLMYDLYSTIL